MQNFGVTSKEYYGMLWYFLEWSIRSPLPPLSIPLGLSLALTQSIGATWQNVMVYWSEKTLGTRKRTNDVINFYTRANKQEKTELLLTAHKLLQKIVQFRVQTVLLSTSRDGLSFEVSSKQVKEVVYVIWPYLLTRTNCS